MIRAARSAVNAKGKPPAARRTRHAASDQVGQLSNVISPGAPPACGADSGALAGGAAGLTGAQPLGRT
jgi:hypothetical protein